MRLCSALVLHLWFMWAQTVLMLGGINKQDGSKLGGGRSVLRMEDFPYVVSIIWKAQLHCGGSLLNPLFVVTACHCVSKWVMDDPVPKKLEPTNLKFVAGTKSIQNEDLKDGQIRQAREFFHHPQCRMIAHQWVDYDIGLAEMAQPFEINLVVKPVNLLSLNTTEYEDQTKSILENEDEAFCTVAGFKRKSKKLTAIRTYPYPTGKCLRDYENRGYHGFGDGRRMLCLLGDIGQSLNIRDTGAAWVCQGYMMGVFTYVMNGFPVVCMKFSSGLDWLRRVNVCSPESGCTIPTEPTCGRFCRKLKNEVHDGVRRRQVEYTLIVWSILVLTEN